MLHYRTRFTAPLDREQVFADISRFDRASEWDPGVEHAEMLTPEPVAQGSRFALRTRFLGRTVPFEYEIVAFEPGARVVLRAENAFVRSIDTITFESAGDQATTISYDATLDPRGATRLATPLLAMAFRRIGDHAAAGLRARLGVVPAA
jgi:hypothetical protein